MFASKKAGRGAGAALLAGVLAIGGYALTNQIGFQESTTLAGLGEQEVQVLQVNDIDYALDAANPSEVESITFVLNSAIASGAGDANAYAQINDTATWDNCGPVVDGATSVVCNIADVAISEIGESGEEVKLVLGE